MNLINVYEILGFGLIINTIFFGLSFFNICIGLLLIMSFVVRIYSFFLGKIGEKKKEIRGKVYYILNKEKVLEKTNKYNKSRAEMVNKIKREKYKNDEEFRKKVNEKNNKWNREHNGKNKNII